MNKYDKPEQSFMLDGTRPTDRFRIRTVGFFYTVIEQLWEHRDGSAEWRRAWSPIEFDGRMR